MKEKKAKDEYKTQITMSLHKSMWQQIQERASKQGISASSYVCLLLSKDLKKEKTK